MYLPTYPGTQSFLKADGATFVILNEYYAKDKNQVFSIEGGYSDIFHDLEGVDPDDFEVLDFAYASDGTNVYGLVLGYEWYSIEKIEDASPVSFQPISRYISKDKNHVFTETKIFDGPDPATFKYYGTEEEHVIDDKEGFFHDDQNVYYLRHNSGVKLDTVDLASFEIIPTDFEGRPLARDKNHVFRIIIKEINEVQSLYEIEEIPLAIDIATFKYIGDENNTSILQDKNGTWALDWLTGELSPTEI